MSGYEMKSLIEQSVGYFWQESYGQLYPTLRKLQKSGHVTHRTKSSRTRPDKKIYRITAAGRKRLREWLASPTPPEPVRNELLLKMFFGMFADHSVIGEHVQTLLDGQQKRLKKFERIEKTELKALKGQPMYPFWLSTLRFGRYVTRARIQWCREALSWLRSDRPKKEEKR
jgi:PadR family transcriptional regulator AphA